MNKKSSDKNDNVFPEFSTELNLPENINRRTFLIRNAVIGAAAAMTGTVWTSEARAAQASKEALEKAHRFSKPIVTQVVPAVTFYPAEDYHQQYLEKRGLASCHIKS